MIAEKDIQPLCNIIASDVLSKLDGNTVVHHQEASLVQGSLFYGFVEIYCSFLNLDLAFGDAFAYCADGNGLKFEEVLSDAGHAVDLTFPDLGIAIEFKNIAIKALESDLSVRSVQPYYCFILTYV